MGKCQKGWKGWCECTGRVRALNKEKEGGGNRGGLVGVERFSCQRRARPK